MVLKITLEKMKKLSRPEKESQKDDFIDLSVKCFLNLMCVSQALKTHILKPNPQGDDNRSWGLGEVLGHKPS